MRFNGTQPGSLYTASGRRKYLTASERERFIAASRNCARADQRSLCLTLAYTGCRISEALGLYPASIEREGGFIAFRTLKKRDALSIREVPVPVDLLEALTTTPATPDPNAKLWKLSRSRAWRLVKDIMKAAGIPPGIHATPKGLRHGFGIHAIQSGVPLNLVQRWLGHARMETTAIYLQAIGTEERQIAAKMWGSLT